VIHLTDPVLERWAPDTLVWLPEHGVGYYPVQATPADVYDDVYWAKYERYAETEMGCALTRVRHDLVARFTDACWVCDVGIGSGQFVERAGCTGYDVAPRAVRWLKDRRAWRDPREQPVETATFWDSLEHIPDVHRILANVRRWVFVTLPIVPGEGPPRPDWRHYRPDEHWLYFTRAGLIRWMGAHGFECVEHGTPESLLGRLDIETFVFRRPNEGLAGPPGDLRTGLPAGDLSRATDPPENMRSCSE